MWSTTEQINCNLFAKQKSAGFFTHTWNYNKRLEKEWEINEQINCNLFGKWKFAGLFTHIWIGWGWEIDKNQIMCTEGFCYQVLINILDWHLIDTWLTSWPTLSHYFHQYSVNTWSTSQLTVSQDSTNFWTWHRVSIDTQSSIEQVLMECPARCWSSLNLVLAKYQGSYRFSETNFQDFSRTHIDFSRALKFTLTPTLPRS